MKHTSRNDIKKKIAEILLDHNWVKPGEEVHERHSYENDYGMDSLDKLELAMDLGREYGVYIPDEVEERMNTVAITIDYIHQQLNNYESKQN